LVAACMHRAYRNLVQALALGGQECVSERLRRRIIAGTERVPHAPEAQVEPRPCVRKAPRIQPAKVAQCPLKPDSRWVQRADRRKATLRAFDCDNGDFRAWLVEHGHMRRARIAPQPEQRLAADRYSRGTGAPPPSAPADARPGTMAADPLTCDLFKPRHYIYPSSLATFWNHEARSGGM